MSLVIVLNAEADVLKYTVGNNNISVKWQVDIISVGVVERGEINNVEFSGQERPCVFLIGNIRTRNKEFQG